MPTILLGSLPPPSAAIRAYYAPVQRIEVTDEGITVTLVAEPLLSVFGKEMRPGSTTVSALLWEEISDVSLSATQLEPDGVRCLTLTVDTSCGEYFEVHEGAGGLSEAVDHLCRASGISKPDVAALSGAGMVIWPGPAPARPEHDPNL
jgi:hypothetical protein